MEKIKRKIFANIEQHLWEKEFTILVGARQTGKTTLLLQLKQLLDDKKKKVYFFTLEDIRILNDLNQTPENIFKYIPKGLPDKSYVLIDEVQYLENPSNFLKYLYDLYSQNIKIVATGSSAFYIDKKFSDSLAGRKKIFELYTLSFEEYLLFNNAESLISELKIIKQQSNYTSLYRNDIELYFSDYLTYGSYPGVVLKKTKTEKIDLLKELFSSYLKKDITESGVQNHDKFFKLLTLLAHQTGTLLNVNELANTLGLSVTAINNYIYILEKSFHINTINPFYKNIRKELTKMPKVYFNDIGFRNIAMNYFNKLEERIDRGAVVENYIFMRLRDIYGKNNVKFWRTTTGNEVDFVYFNDEKYFAIESKYKNNEYSEKKYKKFTETYSDIELKCLAYVSYNNNNNIISL